MSKNTPPTRCSAFNVVCQVDEPECLFCSTMQPLYHLAMEPSADDNEITDSAKAAFEEPEPQQEDANSVSQQKTIDLSRSVNIDQAALLGPVNSELERQIVDRLNDSVVTAVVDAFMDVVQLTTDSMASLTKVDP